MRYTVPKDDSSVIHMCGSAFERLIFLTVLLIAAVFPIERANATGYESCGSWTSPYGSFDPNLEFLEVYSSATCYYDITFDSAFTPETPIDLEFAVFSGINYYYFDTELVDSVYNQTFYHWDDYHFEIGTGTAFVGNWSAFAYNGSDPVFTGAAQSDVFGTGVVSAHMIDFAGATVPTQTAVNFSIGVFVPSDFTGDTVTLRQYFTVPEPATLLLMGLGLAGIGFVGRRRLGE